MLTLTLSVGTHRLILTGKDTDNNVATDEVTMTVESDFDGDGIPDVDEPDNFWNPDDAGMVISGVTKLDWARGVSGPPGRKPGLAVGPSALEWTAERGQTSAQGVLTIRSTDVLSLTWTAAKTQAWLSLSAASGQTLATLSATANAASLADGIYTDTIRIQAGVFSQTVPVTLTVVSRSPLKVGPHIYLPIVIR